MNTIRPRALLVVFGVTLGSAILQQVFITLLFERNPSALGLEAALGLPPFLAVLAAVLVWYFVLLSPLTAFLKAGKASAQGALRTRLSRLPRALFWGNGFLFFLVPVAALAVRPFFGIALPSVLDACLIVLLNVAFGFLGSLQQIAAIEALTLPVRVRLGLTQAEGVDRDFSLRQRLFLVNLASVLLSGLLAGMAALGFYREVVTYYTSLSVDAVSAATTVSAQAVSANEVKVVVQLAVLFLGVLVWTLWLTAMALSTVSRQLKTLTQRVAEMADGSADLGKRAEVVFFDEVGLLTGRINAVMERMQALVGSIQETTDRVASSTGTVQTVSRDAEGRLGAVSRARLEADDALGSQGLALESALTVARDLEAASVTVKAAANEQGDAVNQGAAAMEQLAASVASVTDLTVKADALAASLRQTSEQGGRSVDAVRASMVAIQEAAAAVAGTVKSIKKSASQTNLLAMNAAIEAAHAGSQGRGFAVVANEVRILAEDSSRGAKTIADHMRAMASKIDQGDRLAHEAGDAFHRIYELVVQTSQVISTVAHAMEEQRVGTETLVVTTRTLREASAHIGEVTGRQAAQADQLHQSVRILVDTGASLAMAQDVQGRAMEELSSLVKLVVLEADHNRRVADGLGEAVAGFTVR